VGQAAVTREPAEDDLGAESYSNQKEEPVSGEQGQMSSGQMLGSVCSGDVPVSGLVV
jgi:hypothetical protein